MITFPCAEKDATGNPSCFEKVYYPGVNTSVLIGFAPMEIRSDETKKDIKVVTLKCCKDHVHNYIISHVH